MEEGQLCRGSADRPEQPASTVLSIEEEAIVIAFRRYTLLPLDDCLYALQATIPHLTRSIVASLPEAARHLAPAAGQGRGRRQAKIQSVPDRSFSHRHRRAAHSRGQALLFVAIDRTSKFVFVPLHEKADRPTA